MTFESFGKSSSKLSPVCVTMAIARGLRGAFTGSRRLNVAMETPTLQASSSGIIPVSSRSFLRRLFMHPIIYVCVAKCNVKVTAL